MPTLEEYSRSFPIPADAVGEGPRVDDIRTDFLNRVVAHLKAAGVSNPNVGPGSAYFEIADEIAKVQAAWPPYPTTPNAEPEPPRRRPHTSPDCRCSGCLCHDGSGAPTDGGFWLGVPGYANRPA
jgi:hypothetical protein